MKNEMSFSGERVILGAMPGRARVVQEHITRYNFALGILEQHGCKKVLDAACGTGYGSMIMEECGYDVYGVDIDKGAINQACRINSCNAATFKEGSLDEPEKVFPGKKFDAVVSFETIEHLKNPDRFLEWTKTKAGLLIFSLPIEQPSEFHLQVYTPDEAVHQIKKHYSNVTFLSQSYMNIYEFNPLADRRHYDYIIGYAKQ